MKYKYFVYILHSETFLRLYIGQTNNLHSRFERHNAGMVRFTKPYRPWKILYTESYETRSLAIKREKFLKSGKGREFIHSLRLI